MQFLLSNISTAAQKAFRNIRIIISNRKSSKLLSDQNFKGTVVNQALLSYQRIPQTNKKFTLAGIAFKSLNEKELISLPTPMTSTMP